MLEPRRHNDELIPSPPFFDSVDALAELSNLLRLLGAVVSLQLAKAAAVL